MKGEDVAEGIPQKIIEEMKRKISLLLAAISSIMNFNLGNLHMKEGRRRKKEGRRRKKEETKEICQTTGEKNMDQGRRATESVKLNTIHKRGL